MKKGNLNLALNAYHFMNRYAKVNEVLNNCSIGAKINFLLYEEENATFSIKDSSAFFGQMGPVYLFNDVITPEQVQGIYSLGPSYMYSFLDNEVSVFRDGPLPGGVLDAKDGLASKIIFGLNAQVLFADAIVPFFFFFNFLSFKIFFSSFVLLKPKDFIVLGK